MTNVISNVLRGVQLEINIELTLLMFENIIENVERIIF